MHSVIICATMTACQWPELGYSLLFGLFSLTQMRDATWTPRDVFDRVDDHIRVAEQTGFETARFGEPHFTSFSLCPSSLRRSARFAVRTSHIRLGDNSLTDIIPGVRKECGRTPLTTTRPIP